MIIYDTVIKTYKEYAFIKRSYDIVLFVLSECDHCERLLNRINENADILVVFIDKQIDAEFLKYLSMHNIKLPCLVINGKELDLCDDLLVLYINSLGELK